MANWILGHSDRFKALVSHAGVYDCAACSERPRNCGFQCGPGAAPWDNPEIYAKLSPSFYAKEFKTPTLVIHGERDYRVPFGQDYSCSRR